MPFSAILTGTLKQNCILGFNSIHLSCTVTFYWKKKRKKGRITDVPSEDFVSVVFIHGVVSSFVAPEKSHSRKINFLLLFAAADFFFSSSTLPQNLVWVLCSQCFPGISAAFNQFSNSLSEQAEKQSLF